MAQQSGKSGSTNGVASPWVLGHAYAAGDLVSYGGVTYVALQGATSIATWSPTLAASLWAPLGAPVVTPAPVPVPAPVGSAPAWSAGSVYTGGMTASFGGIVYKANWWTQGNDPSKNSGAAGSGQPWTVVGPAQPGTPPVVTPPVVAPPVVAPPVVPPVVVTPPAITPPPPPPPAAAVYAPAWTASGIYTAGMTAALGGFVYRASWWTQGLDPSRNSGLEGSGQAWTLVGPLKPVTVVPTSPTALIAGGIGATSVSLYWGGSTVPGGGEVQGYVVFKDGARIGTTTGTSFTATGLAAGTAYSFTVAAEDAAGLSAPSAARAVTTVGVNTRPVLPPSFAPYIDMGLAADADLVGIAARSGARTFTLAFLQSSGPGTIGWSGVGTLGSDGLSNGSTILAQIEALRAAGGDVIISFGGASGIDPAKAATSVAQLQGEYQSVIDRYHVTSLDFDIEGAEVADARSTALRDQALIGLKAANPGLTISFTLPVLPTGLDNNGLAVLQATKRDGLAPDVVNVMAMDYGASVDNGGQMGLNAISAAQNTIAQMRFIGLDAKVGITPMIGVNDVSTEVFTLADARMLLAFAQGNADVARLSMWSIARDNGRGAGSAWASYDTSGVAQQDFEFSSIFRAFGG